MNDKKPKTLVAVVQTPKESNSKKGAKIPETMYKRGTTPKGESVKKQGKISRVK